MEDPANVSNIRLVWTVDGLEPFMSKCSNSYFIYILHPEYKIDKRIPNSFTHFEVVLAVHSFLFK